MKKITDKLLILLIIMTVSLVKCTDINYTVMAFLMSVAVSSFSQALENKYVCYTLNILFILVCIFIPEFLIFAGLPAYEIMYRGSKYLIFAAIPFSAFSCMQIGVQMGIAAGVVIVIAFHMCYRTKKVSELTEQLIYLRDSSEENKILLMEKNKALISNHDYEVNFAVLNERNRIAREIHDNVGHMLSRTLLQMGALKIINKDKNLVEPLDNISQSLNTAMTSIRESVHNLHDDAIHLKNTVLELVRPLEDDYKVNTDIDISENAPKDVKLCFIGIIKESISNILRHSNGDTVSIVLREHPAFFQAVVEDNGTNNGSINESGIGLENMKNRAEKLNGLFEFNMEKNKFRIFVSIPKK